jgi:hypothetical protein
MKKLLLLLLAVAAIGGLAATSLAHPPYQKPPAKPAPKAPAIGSPAWLKAIHTRVVATLGLTAVQRKAIDAAFDRQTAAQVKMQKDFPFKSGNDPNNQKRAEAMQKLNNTFNAEAKKALGPKYNPYVKKMGEELQKEAAKMGMGGLTPEKIQALVKVARARVSKQMGLTAAQQKSIDATEAKAQKDMMTLSTSMAASGKNYNTMTKAEKDKMNASFKKITDARTASMTKILGNKKLADYDKLLSAELQKEMAKLMPKPPAKPKS